MNLEEEIDILFALRVPCSKRDSKQRVFHITEEEFCRAISSAYENKGKPSSMQVILNTLKQYDVVTTKQGTKPINTIKNLMLNIDALTSRITELTEIENQKGSSHQ